MLDKVAIQHAQDTGRYHPTFYRWAPMPGPGPQDLERYKSAGHHTEGFETLPEAFGVAVELAEKLEASADDFTVFEVPMAGPQVIFQRR